MYYIHLTLATKWFPSSEYALIASVEQLKLVDCFGHSNCNCSIIINTSPINVSKYLHSLNGTVIYVAISNTIYFHSASQLVPLHFLQVKSYTHLWVGNNMANWIENFRMNDKETISYNVFIIKLFIMHCKWPRDVIKIISISDCMW